MQTQPGADAGLEPEAEPDGEPAEQVQRYELDPEPESEVESPPTDEENVEETTGTSEEDIEHERNAVQGRIDKLTENWRTAERTAEQLREENVRLQQPEPKADEAVKTLADFDYDEAQYSAWVFARAEEGAKRTAEETVLGFQQWQVAERRGQEHQSREGDFAGKTPDYWETVNGVPVTAAQREVIESSDIGPELVYYLGKNPTVAQELARTPPLVMAKRMALLEGEIGAAKKAASDKTVSKAPPPPKKVKGGDPGLRVSATTPASDKLSDKDWLKRREAQLAKQRG